MRDASLDACLGEFLHDAASAPGIVVRAERPGTASWTGAAGLASLTPARPMEKDATFRTASVTKTFTAAAILRLWEEGRLDLDRHLDPFLPKELVDRLNVIEGRAYGHEITIQHLLQHASGVYQLDSAPYVTLIMDNPSRRWHPLEQIDLTIRGGAPFNRPGAATRYSNTGYIILSIIIEKASGLPLAQAFRSLLRFDELGLKAIHLETLEDVPSGAGPRMRQYFGEQDVTDLDASIDLYGGGGLVSDVADLAGFWRALFDGRIFDSPATLERMCGVIPFEQDNGEVGLGIFRKDMGDVKIWSHTGFWGSFVLYEPVTQIIVAGSTNQDWSHLPRGVIDRLCERVCDVMRQN